jgi:hypothetical protein
MTLARRGFVALPLALAAGAAQAQLKPPPPPEAPQSIWYAVRGVDNSFIVDMPGEPVYKLIDTASSGGTKFVYHSYSLDYRRLAFVAQTAASGSGSTGTRFPARRRPNRSGPSQAATCCANSCC